MFTRNLKVIGAATSDGYQEEISDSKCLNVVLKLLELLPTNTFTAKLSRKKCRKERGREFNKKASLQGCEVQVQNPTSQ